MSGRDVAEDLRHAITRKNVDLTYFYVNQPSLKKFKDNFDSFLADAFMPPSAPVPSVRP